MSRCRKLVERSCSWMNRVSLRIGVSMQTLSVRLRPDGGQTVAEYALVLLVVAAIAVAFLLWARQSGKLDSFFDAIFAKLLDSVDPAPTATP
jgi:hypothetical protein